MTQTTIYLHTGSRPISKSKDTAFTVLKEHPWVRCNLLTELLVSLAVGASQTWQTAVPVSVASYSSRSRALGCLSILFLSTPAANKSAHIFSPVTRMGPLLASPPIRVFRLLIPLACHCPSTSPKPATIEVAVKEPKEVDETVFKMASCKPPVKHLSSGGSSPCQASVGAKREDVQPTSSMG